MKLGEYMVSPKMFLSYAGFWGRNMRQWSHISYFKYIYWTKYKQTFWNLEGILYSQSQNVSFEVARWDNEVISRGNICHDIQTAAILDPLSVISWICNITVEKLVNHSTNGSWFTSYSLALPTSRLVYCAGKPIENVVYCLINDCCKILCCITQHTNSSKSFEHPCHMFCVEHDLRFKYHELA